MDYSIWYPYLYAAFAVLNGVIAGFLSRDNGRGFTLGFVLGAFLLVIGIAISAVSPREETGTQATTR